MSHVLVLLVQGARLEFGDPSSILAIDGLAVIGTVGFFVPAAILVGLVTWAVIRDRRLVALERQDDGEHAESPE